MTTEVTGDLGAVKRLCVLIASPAPLRNTVNDIALNPRDYQQVTHSDKCMYGARSAATHK